MIVFLNVCVVFVVVLLLHENVFQSSLIVACYNESYLYENIPFYGWIQLIVRDSALVTQYVRASPSIAETALTFFKLSFSRVELQEF